jgi:hypothetical protein
VTADRWAGYGLAQIWQMLAGEDGRVSWSQHDAWRRMARTCDEQAEQLSRAVERLLERWPARPASASAALKLWMDGLVESMRESARAAASNRDAICEITLQLRHARDEVGALMAQRAKFAHAEEQMYEYIRANIGTGRRPGDPIAPRREEPQRPPDNWQATLDQHARDIMAHTDAAVGAQARRFSPPVRFDVRVSNAEAPLILDSSIEQVDGASIHAGAMDYSSLASNFTPQRGWSLPIPNSGPVLAGSPATPPSPDWRAAFADTSRRGDACSATELPTHCPSVRRTNTEAERDPTTSTKGNCWLPNGR